MFVIPAIDIKDGRCVRLFQGREEETVEYFDDPMDAARKWARFGVRRIHVVDLDGAFSGGPANRNKVLEIAAFLRERGIECEVGGGMRSEKDAEGYLDAGIDRVVLGTMAAKEPARFSALARRWPGRVNLSLDCRGEEVVIKGWVEGGGVGIGDLLENLKDAPIGEVVYTEVSRDGTLQGIDPEGLERVVALSRWPVVASGGVGSIADVKTAAAKGAWGVIIGKALYDGRVDLAEAVAAAG